jgi:aspartyl-tRNA(Asn)/glutamyl-tRNA(Gln) amidotransferase subunit B
LLESLPELPWEKRDRFIKNYGLKEDVAELFVHDPSLGTFFEKVVAGKTSDFIKLATNYITSDLMALIKEDAGEIYPYADNFIKLIEMIVSNRLSSRGAKDVLAEMYRHGGDPETIAKKQSLIQIHDSEILITAVDAVIVREEKAVLEYKSGKQAALQYLVGKAIKESGGAGNPENLRKIIIEKLVK